jgi:FkbM family methyltransferase
MSAPGDWKWVVDLPEGAAIDFIDVGCSGKLDARWVPLASKLAYVGFDPNTEECARLHLVPHPYASARYFPFAIAGQEGEVILHLTASGFCHSMLEPNRPWLERFVFSPLFADAGETRVECITLDALHQRGVVTRADVIKLDTQGMELPILRSAGRLLEGCLCVETETGLTDNYHSETRFDQVAAFMRDSNFILYDLVLQRMPRKNDLQGYGIHQPLWCEAIWIRDLVRDGGCTREAVLKMLMICRTLGFSDFGAELAAHAFGSGLLSPEQATALGEPATWVWGTLNVFRHRLRRRVRRWLPV